jgi:hypothetical protein
MIEDGGQGSAKQMWSQLRDGLEKLDLDEEITFQAYSRVVLPIDGYVYWTPTTTRCVKGALTYTQEIQQNEDETYGAATVLFTAEEKIVAFESAPINVLFVACVDGFRFAISQQQGFFGPAGLWHYFAQSIPPALASQLLDAPNMLDPAQAVVSNSLPAWLQLNGYKSPYYDGFSNPDLVLYPSDLVSPNLVPPYGAVHITPDARALQAAPYLDVNRNHWQLVADKVRITLYGLQNNAAMDFVDLVNQYSLQTECFGIMNVPCMRDEKRTHSGLQAIAMKKVIEYEVSYYQMRMAQIGRQLIKDALPITYIFQGGNKPITPQSVLGTDSGQAIDAGGGNYISVDT